MRFGFNAPRGWLRAPFPPPQRGVYLRAPVEKPGPESASILLFDAVAAVGKLEDQLAGFVNDGCDGVKVLKQQKPAPFRTVAFGGLAAQVMVKVDPPKGKTREEARVFALVDAGARRLPVTFVGGAKALSAHGKAFDELLASIGPLVADGSTSPYTYWVD